MSNILITGISGFLGKELCKHGLKLGHTIFGIANSEYRYKDLEATHPDLIVYNFDIGNDNGLIKKIIKDNKIDYIIHTAAMKHVGLCEKNVSRTVEVNILATKKLIEAANELNIKNIIGVSTDKAINPSCIYGMSKFFMEKMLLENSYGVFQGVNFFYSSGSVLEIWDKQRLELKKISANKNAVRYFTLVDEVSKKIFNNLECKNIFSVDECYKINIGKLCEAYCKFYNYNNKEDYDMLLVEKNIEEVPKNVKIIELNVDEIINLFYNSGAKK